MKKLLLSVGVAAMTLVMANAAFATVFPPGAGACTDTMTIKVLKDNLNLLNPCSALTPNTTGTAGDTVLGVGGIVIGFDQIATGYDVYLQMSNGGPNSGIDVFTGGTNMKPVYGFQLGDSVVVEYARVANYYGDVELLSPNGSFSNPNIVFRKVSSGNALPPILHGNTTDFVETPTNTYIAPYMTTLVTLDGPIRVARTGAGLGFNGMLVVRDAAPSDSVYIDYAKLTSIVPPAVGTYLTSITGIVNSASRGWRIMPRDGNDIVDTSPPNITDSYAIADNQYRVVFDRNVTPATATDALNYSLASFGNVDAAVMSGTSAVILTVSGTGLAHGQSETVTANNIVGLANGVAMTSPASRSFLAGVLSCGEMASPNPDSLMAVPCRDISLYQGDIGSGGGTGQYSNGGFGPRSTVTGVVTGVYGNLYYIEDETPLLPANNHRGLTVFAPPQALVPGHKYVLAGAAQEYYSEIEFAAIQYVQDVGTPGIPAPINLSVAIASYDTCDANQNIESARDYLSELVKLTNVKVVQRYTTPTTTGFHVVGPTSTYADTIYIENQNNVLGTYVANNPNYPPLGSLVDVVGVVHYTTSTSTPSFRVCPRNAADITIHGLTGVTPGALSLSFAAYPSPSRSVNLAFTLPTSSKVQLGVYDLFGRRVATLADGVLGAGAHTKAWAGRSDDGAKVGAGVYFYKLVVGDEIRTARSVFLGN